MSDPPLARETWPHTRPRGVAHAPLSASQPVPAAASVGRKRLSVSAHIDEQTRAREKNIGGVRFGPLCVQDPANIASRNGARFQLELAFSKLGDEPHCRLADATSSVAAHRPARRCVLTVVPHDPIGPASAALLAEPDHHVPDGGLALVPVKARRCAPTTPPAWLAALTGSSTEPNEGSYVMVQECGHAPHPGW